MLTESGTSARQRGEALAMPLMLHARAHHDLCGLHAGVEVRAGRASDSRGDPSSLPQDERDGQGGGAPGHGRDVTDGPQAAEPAPYHVGAAGAGHVRAARARVHRRPRGVGAAAEPPHAAAAQGPHAHLGRLQVPREVRAHWHPSGAMRGSCGCPPPALRPPTMHRHHRHGAGTRPSATLWRRSAWPHRRPTGCPTTMRHGPRRACA